MKKLHLSALTVSLCTLAVSASAQGLACNQEYTVKSGDFLSSIAQRAYGNTASYTMIYNANSATIGSNPGFIQIGQRLMIPCLDTAVSASSANTAAIRQQTTETLPAPIEDRPIRVLTATGWPPFLDEDQPQGGLLTEIVNLALEAADNKPQYQIDFINDAGAHLNPLVTDHAYDISIGWSQPNCDDMSKLADESKFRCNNLDFSDPLYEEIFGYYSAATDPVFRAHDELKGKKICRAEGFTLLPLETVGLKEPDIEVVRAPDAPSCIDFLADGRADIALVAVDVAEGRIEKLGVASDIQFQEALTYVDTLHAVISKTNPAKDAILMDINNGLANIKESGVWFDTVRRHMSAFRSPSS